MFTWAVVGSPNSGKTTLYNWLTGARSKTVNYPGATVEYSIGKLRSHLSEKLNYEAEIIDTPGIYSLNPRSEDEVVTYRTLFDLSSQKKINASLVVADATQLNRHLVLLEQLKSTGYPLLLVVTMVDLIKKQKAQLLIEKIKNFYGVNVICFDGLLGGGLDELVQQMKQLELNEKNNSLKVVAPAQWTIQQQDQFLKNAQNVATQAVLRDAVEDQQTNRDFTAKMDQFLLHPIFGFVFFFAFMTVLFASIYWLAQPLMDGIDYGFGQMADAVTNHYPGLFGDFLGSGLVAALGGVIIFIPQIFILFIGIGILEATGYLARVAALIDRPLALIGLGGRSFVPLLSGFACSIPALMATRNITSKKEKMIAQMIIPFMTCSARLPVYGLMIGFLVGDQNPLLAGLLMAGLYFSAILVGVVAAKILSLIIKGERKNRLLMELPAYRRPKLSVILLQSLTKVKSFILRAGPTIIVLALVLWFGTTFPRAPEGSTLSASEVASQSYAAQIGKSIEPVFKPLGVDWRVGFGLISSFAAREVFVSSLAIVFNIEGDEETQTQGLLKAMKEAKFQDGSAVFTVASVVGIFIFFTIALQCISTFGVLKRETGSWKPAILQLCLSNLFAYVLAATAVFVLKSVGL